MASEDKLLVEYNTEHGELKLSPNIVRRYLVNGQGNVTDQEVFLFINLCRYQQLNPFLKEVYLIKYSRNAPATIVTSKDTFIKRAEKHPQYDGSRAGIYVQRDKTLDKRIGTLVLLGEKLVGGWAEIYRKDWQYSVEISVSYQEYEGKTKEGDPNSQWSRMPATMIRKAALVQALREAFPDQFQGMYDSSEMQMDDNILDNSSVSYQVYPDTSAPEKQEYEKPKEKSEEYKKIEEQIYKDLNNPLFKGTVQLDGKDADLDHYKREIPQKLQSQIFKLSKLQQTADTITRMLLVAADNVKETKPDEISDKEDLFETEEPEETEGNLSTEGG